MDSATNCWSPAATSLGRRWTFAGKKLDTVLGLTGTTRIEAQEVKGIDRDASSTAFLAEDDLSLIAERLTLRFDRTDNSTEPTFGWYAQGSTEVGEGCDIGPDSQLTDCKVGAGSTVRQTVADGAVIGPGCDVGPFAVLHKGNHLLAGTTTGAFYTGDDG